MEKIVCVCLYRSLCMCVCVYLTMCVCLFLSVLCSSNLDLDILPSNDIEVGEGFTTRRYCKIIHYEHFEVFDLEMT